MTNEPKQDQAPQPQGEIPEGGDWDTVQIIAEKIEQARQAGKFMVCVFRVDDTGKLTLDRSTWQFPVVDFDSAVNLLKTDLDKSKAGVTETREEMAEANPLPPVIDLFGKPPAPPAEN